MINYMQEGHVQHDWNQPLFDAERLTCGSRLILAQCLLTPCTTAKSVGDRNDMIRRNSSSYANTERVAGEMVSAWGDLIRSPLLLRLFVDIVTMSVMSMNYTDKIA